MLSESATWWHALRREAVSSFTAGMGAAFFSVGVSRATSVASSTSFTTRNCVGRPASLHEILASRSSWDAVTLDRSRSTQCGPRRPAVAVGHSAEPALSEPLRQFKMQPGLPEFF